MAKKNKFNKEPIMEQQYRIEVIETGDDYMTKLDAERQQFYCHSPLDMPIEKTILSIKGDSVETIMQLIKLVEDTRKEKDQLQATLSEYKKASENLNKYLEDK